MSKTPAPVSIEHYENFPVASLLCPPALRPPIAAIYHFARTADDIADEGSADATARLNDLWEYRQQLVLAANPQTEPLQFNPRWTRQFVPLQRAIHQFGLPVYLLEHLLDAFTQDVKMTRDGDCYRTVDELHGYCQRSANPVGRLLLHLYGVQDEQAKARSDDICTALQLINFWQDPSVDLPRQRNYFPMDLCVQHGVHPQTLQQQTDNGATRALLRELVNQARNLMLRGAPLERTIPGRAGWELRFVVQGGLRIATKIEQTGFATLRERPKLSKLDYLGIAWRAILM